MMDELDINPPPYLYKDKDTEKEKKGLSNEAKKKALSIKEFVSDMGSDDLSEKFRERYK